MADPASAHPPSPRPQDPPVLPPMMGARRPARHAHARRTQTRQRCAGCGAAAVGLSAARRRVALLATSAMVARQHRADAAWPYLLAVAIDDYMLPRDLAGLGRICLEMLAVYAASALLTWLQLYIMAGVAQHTVQDLRNDLFARLQQLPLRFFDEHAHGDLMSRLTNDLEQVNSVLSENLMQLISGVLGLVGAALAMLWLNPRLAAHQPDLSGRSSCWG